jgi:hypothetical protein
MGKLMVELPDSMHGELKKKAAAEHTTLKRIISGLIGDYLSAPERRETSMKKTGLCGSWDDDRPAEKIIREIRGGRTWFVRRKA